MYLKSENLLICGHHQRKRYGIVELLKEINKVTDCWKRRVCSWLLEVDAYQHLQPAYDCRNFYSFVISYNSLFVELHVEWWVNWKASDKIWGGESTVINLAKSGSVTAIDNGHDRWWWMTVWLWFQLKLCIAIWIITCKHVVTIGHRLCWPCAPAT